MDHPKNIESTLNALLLNASELKEHGQDPVKSIQLSHEQQRLIDILFNSWDQLTDVEKKELLASKVESKIQELAKENQGCLLQIRRRKARNSSL